MKLDKTFYLEESCFERLKQLAHENELSCSKMVERCISDMPTLEEINKGDLPDMIENLISILARSLKRTRLQVIESILINYLAHRVADQETYPNAPLTPLPEFSHTQEGPLLGKQLFLFLRDLYKGILKDHKKSKRRMDDYERYMKALGSTYKILDVEKTGEKNNG